jgi:hypothetical protein
MAFILLCVAVIIIAAPTPAPWGSWVALALAVVALIVYCLGLHGSRLVDSGVRESAPMVYSGAPLRSGFLGSPADRFRPDGSRIDDVPVVPS